MRYIIYGAGALGGVMGARLFQAGVSGCVLFSCYHLRQSYAPVLQVSPLILRHLPEVWSQHDVKA